MTLTSLGFRFGQPELLWLLALVPLLWWAARTVARARRATIRYSDIALVAATGATLRTRLVGLPRVLRMIALALLVVAMARPQFGFSRESVKTLGVDIMIAVDLSESMMAADFNPHRLAAAKEATKEFVRGRPSDNIGVVGFADVAVMLCPLTPEYDIVLEFIEKLTFKILGGSTALGDAVMLSAKRLESSPAKSKVIVAMTDGRNTAGQADPLKAAEVAGALGIRVYTIGIGSNQQQMGSIFASMRQQFEFDPETLKAMADISGGSYFHATDKNKFDEVFREIDALEKTHVERTLNRNYDEKFWWFAGAAFVLLALELLLSRTVLRRLP